MGPCSRTGDLIGFGRNSGNAADLADRGIEIREGDYFDLDGLVRSFAGVEKVMLVSATAFTDRNTQHANAIGAAREAGLRHLVFMPIIDKTGSDVLPKIADEDAFAEDAIKASGLVHTIVRHPPFLETIEGCIGSAALEAGVHVPVGEGKAVFASREDLAEAHAVVLTEAGHENRTYSLFGGSAVSFTDIADILSTISGKSVPIRCLLGSGLRQPAHRCQPASPAADFLLEWVRGINAGESDGETGDLEMLLGRKPTSASKFLHATYPPRRR